MGVPHEYETVALPYTLRKNYLPDFVCDTPNGRVFIEVKGYFRPGDRVKILAALREVPKPDIRMAFAVNNKLSRHTKTRYGDWCDRHNIKWCVGKIPESWFQ